MCISSDQATTDDPPRPPLVEFPGRLSVLLARAPLSGLSSLEQVLEAPLTALAVTSEQLIEDWGHLDAQQVRALVSTLRCQTLELQALVGEPSVS
jgi:hypothetical protein